MKHQPESIVNSLSTASELPQPSSMLIMCLSWKNYKISSERSIDAWMINPPHYPRIVLFLFCTYSDYSKWASFTPNPLGSLQSNVQGHDWQVTFCHVSFCAAELSFRWILNEFPTFIPLDNRRFVSQITGNLYISKVDSSDSGNYSCIASSSSISKSVFSNYIPLVPLAER